MPFSYETNNITKLLEYSPVSLIEGEKTSHLFFRLMTETKKDLVSARECIAYIIVRIHARANALITNIVRQNCLQQEHKVIK